MKCAPRARESECVLFAVRSIAWQWMGQAGCLYDNCKYQTNEFHCLLPHSTVCIWDQNQTEPHSFLMGAQQNVSTFRNSPSSYGFDDARAYVELRA